MEAKDSPKVTRPKEKRVSLSETIFIKPEVEYEPTEKDKLQGDVEGAAPYQPFQLSAPVADVFEGDPGLTVEGQVMYMTNSRRSLSKRDSLRRGSIALSMKELGWRRYLGLIYTLLSTNMFSLSSNVLKKMGHVHPTTLGCYAFPMGAALSAPFIWYTLKVEKLPVAENIWPISKNKKTVFFMVLRSTFSLLISYGLIASFHYISVADSRTILAASVITVNFFGWICLGEKCGVVPIFVAIMALLGIGIMTRPPMLTGGKDFDTDNLIGVALAFVCMLLATSIILCLRFLQNVHHGVLNTFLYAWAFVVTLPVAIAWDKVFIPQETTDILIMLSVGMLWAAGNTFLVLALQVEEAGVVALIRTSEVIFTFFWQMIIVNVYPDYISMIGAVLVLTGVIVVTLRKWASSLDKTSSMRKRLAFLLL